MMEWLHCNACYLAPTMIKGTSIFLTSCDHIVCARCLNGAKFVNTPARSEACLICKKTTKYSEINRNLDPEKAIYFRSLDNLTVEYRNKLNKVAAFQKSHWLRLIKYKNSQISSKSTQLEKASKMVKASRAEAQKYRDYALEMKKCQDRLAAENREKSDQLERMANELARCQKELADAKRSSRTPVSHSSGSRRRYAEDSIAIPQTHDDHFNGDICDLLGLAPEPNFILPTEENRVLDTPALLGISSKKFRNTSDSKSGSFFNI